MNYSKILFCLLGVACFSKIDIQVGVRTLDGVSADSDSLGSISLLTLDQDQTLLEQIESSLQNIDRNTQIQIALDGSHLSDSALRSLLKRAGMSASFCQYRKGIDKWKRMDSLSNISVKLRDMAMSAVSRKSDNSPDSSNGVSSVVNFYFSQSNNSYNLQDKNQQSKMSDVEFAEYIFNIFRYLKVKNVTKVSLTNMGKKANETIDSMNKFFIDIYGPFFTEGLENFGKSYASSYFASEKGKITNSNPSGSSGGKDIPPIADIEAIERFLAFENLEGSIKHLEKYEAVLKITPKVRSKDTQSKDIAV